MKNTIFWSAGAACAAILATHAVAGYYQPQAVQVDFDGSGGGSALGDMITARNDADPDVFIGCGVRTIEFGGGGLFETGFCQAEDDEGDQVTCFTQNPDLLDTMRATADYSFLTFSFVDDGGGGYTCTRIGFSTQSFYLPEIKKAK